jgi:glycosyltransferase involved in cell wall biosynthesis
MKNILFVSHDANRAGAQILLLRFLKLLKNDSNFTFSILLKNGGIIEQDFIDLADTYFWYPNDGGGQKSIPVKFFNKLTKSESLYRSSLIKKLQAKKFDLIVANTVTNGDLLPTLSALNCPIKTYVHELEIGIQQYTQSDFFQNVLSLSNSFIACGEAVKQNLRLNHGVDATKIKVLPSLLPEVALSFQADWLKNKTLKNQLGIPENALVVGGIGTVDLRKGVDVFIQVAQQLKSQKDVFFIWLGGQASEIEFKIFQIDITQLGLSNVVFQTTVNNPLDYLSCFDVFFVSSREDPYPLVVLEAATLAKPIICFDKAGGAKDFVENDAGFVVDYLAVEKVCEKIVELKDNAVLRKQLGENARKKVLERHHQDKAFQTFVEILNETN